MRKIFLIVLVGVLACALAVAFADPGLAAAKAKKTTKKKGGRKGPRVNPEVAFQQALTRLDPQTRLEQICDREAMKRIKDDKKVPVDRAQGSASAEAKTNGDKLTAVGGAYRTKGGWFGLTYVCQSSTDHMKVLSFEYQTGDAIPKAKWEDYGLWD